MAAVTQLETVTILVNDVELEVPKGEIIVESVKRLGLEIPIFCYHQRMKPVGMCRMCLVEVGFRQPDGSVKKMPKPQAACTLPASDGMAIYTDTEMVHRDRKGVLEFLLINHPLDCPICDRGGECPLQNNTLFYGPSTSRFVEIKRHLPKAFPLSRYVTLDLERCIQCGRCVRFTEEISGDAQLAFRFRGANMQPSTFEMTDFDSKFSGNVIEICPVGALTSAKYRFRARPWDLETRPAICTVCSNGCNVWFDFRVDKMVRINGRTNEAVNEEWTCDRGKFGHDWYNADRLTVPLKRDGDQLVESDWASAYSAIIEAFAAGGNLVAGLGGADNSNEDLFLFQRLFRRDFASNNLDHRFTRTLPAGSRRLSRTLGVAQVQTPIAELENRNAILVFGTSLADEQPIVFLRTRKAWFQNGARVIVAHDGPTDVDTFAHLVLRYRPGSGNALAAGLLNALVVAGSAKVPDAMRKELAKFTPEVVEQATGVSPEQLSEAAEIAAGATLITTHGLLDQEDGLETIETLAGLAMVTGGEFNLLALRSNDQGAEELGVLPDLLPGGRVLSDSGGDDYRHPHEPGLDTRGIIQGCAEGRIKALWLLGVDPFEEIEDRALVQLALENVDFLVVQSTRETEATRYASIVLPMTAPAEMDGTYTNVERRVQRLKQILPTKGEAKPAWRVFSELGLRIRPGAPYFNASEIMDEIAKTAPAFEGARYPELPPEGRLLPR